MEAIKVDLVAYHGADMREYVECTQDEAGIDPFIFTGYSGYGACFDSFGDNKTKLFDITVSFNTPATDGVVIFTVLAVDAAPGSYVWDARLSDGNTDEVWFRGALIVHPEGSEPPTP
jgi:hypothetical protein